MKKLIILLTIVVILPLFTLVSYADDEAEDYISDFNNAIPEQMGDLKTDTDSLLSASSPRALFTEIWRVIGSEGGAVSSFFLRLIGCAVLLSLSSLCHERMSRWVEVSVGIICSLLIFEPIERLFCDVSATLSSIGDFFSALIPIAIGITALGGAPTSAGVQGTGMYTVLSAVGGVGRQIFLSVSAFGLAMSLLSALGHSGVESITKGVKQLFSRVTGIFTALLTAALSLQTIIASAADSAAMRAAKYAASGLIPIVGSTVAGAISTLTAGMSYARGVVGGGAIVVIVYLALSPLVLLLMYRVSLSLAIIFTDFIGVSGGNKIFSSYRASLDMIITVYSLSALVYLFEIVLFIRIGDSL